MQFIDPDTVTRVKEIDLLTYLQYCEPDELTRVSPNTYSTKTHSSLKISNGKWMWWSRGIGGKTALDFLVKVRGMEFTDAVLQIAAFEKIPVTTHETNQTVKSFSLLPRAPNNDKVMTFAQKVLSHIRNAINEIKNIFKKLVASGSYEDIAAWQNDLDALEKLNDMMLDALNNIEQKNTSASKAEKNTAEAVRDEVKYSYKGKAEDGRSIYKTNYKKGTPKATKQQDLINLVQNVWSKKPITLTVIKNGTPQNIVAKFNPELTERSDLSKMAFGNRKGAASDQRITLDLASDFYQIAEESKYVKSKKESGKDYNPAHHGVTNWEYFVTNLIYEDENGNHIDCFMNIDVKEKADGHYFYSFAIEKGTAPQTLLAVVTDDSATVPIDSISEKGEDVNKNVSEDVVYSTKRATETTEFKKWFGDWQNKPEAASKIVNADGTPKVMYHGTQSSFTAFDKKKAKSYGYYGKGFYFTDSESHAQQYGNSMAVYLDVKNPLEQGKNGISKKQLRKFLEAVAENEDYDIWNYGTEDISEIVDSIYKDDAFAVIQDVNATAIGDFAEAIALFNKVNGTSYDGIVTPTETVVYEPTQIKSVDNIGTYDGSNDDIYFSTKRGTDQKQKQLDIINETNPAPNTYSTWIRTVDDIKTLSETLEDEDWEYEVINPDLTRTDIQNAIESGEITVYRSYPIENGVFVSPSRMEAESYSGDGRVYEKIVDINDVAWIDPTQGQYAKVDDVRFAKKRHWKPNMPKADLDTIKRMVKNELFKTDNYLDNITKWLYNNKNGRTYFALYSTEDESDPTILYSYHNNSFIPHLLFSLLLKVLSTILFFPGQHYYRFQNRHL